MIFNIHPSIIEDFLSNPNECNIVKLQSIFNKKLTDIGLIDRTNITSFSDACIRLGLSEPDLIKPNYDKKYQAFIKLSIIIEGLNDGWKPDFTDDDQYKYYNYFYFKNGSFVFFGTSYDCSNLSVPSALYLKDNETAKYCKDNFIDLYKEYYM
jgi:hypothetical protein